MPQPPNRSSNCRPCPSAPVTPRTATLSVNSRTLRATLAAPPGKYDSPVTSTTGTGASGEIRDTLPQMNSSSMRSPTTRIRLPANPANNRLKRTISPSACIPGSAAPFAGHDDEREARPRHQPVEPPPDPYRLVENLQHQLVDIPGTEQPAVRPPGRRADFVETGGGFHRQAMGFEQLARLERAVAALVSQASIQGPEQTRAAGHQRHQQAIRLQG